MELEIILENKGLVSIQLMSPASGDRGDLFRQS